MEILSVVLRPLFGLAPVLCAVATSACANDPLSHPQAKSTYSRDVAPLFVGYCQPCHSGAAPAGRLSLEHFEDESVARRDPEALEHMLDRIELREMPPPAFAQPAPELLEAFRAWVRQQRAEADCRSKAIPGFAALQRHSNRQLASKLRQTLALPQSYDFTVALAVDDSIEGFTNAAETLTIDAEYVSRYLDAVIAGVDYALRSPDTTSYQTLMRCDTTDESACAREIIERFTSRGLARPAEAAKLDAALNVFSREREISGFDEAVKAAFGATLASPAFLMRVELDGEATEPHHLAPRELAARLSYFLWSAPPDETLLAAADAGQLGSEGGLEQQVTRLLRSPKREALIEGFAAEWLGLAGLAQLESIEPDLKASMIGETKSFLREVLFNVERPVRTLLDADFTFIDDTLAAHYGMPSPGASFALVSTAGTPRTGGLLTQASLLAVTSTPTTASPVKRGAFVLGRLLCAAPPPPPPDAAAAAGGVAANASLRERLLQHRADPACASCHASMDPIGLGLANFDRLGAYREFDDEGEQRPIDASGELPSGEAFANAAELGAALSTHPRFVRCLTEKLLSYALGRRLVAGDRCVPRYVAELGPDASFVSLLTGVVQSRSFRLRSPEEASP